MAKKLSEYFSLIPFKNSSLVLVAINIITIISLFLFSSRIPPVVPLYYGKPYGAEQLAPQSFLALPAVIALMVCIINTALNALLKDEFVRRVLLGGMFVATLFALITIVKIVILVGNI